MVERAVTLVDVLGANGCGGDGVASVVGVRGPRRAEAKDTLGLRVRAGRRGRRAGRESNGSPRAYLGSGVHDAVLSGPVTGTSV